MSLWHAARSLRITGSYTASPEEGAPALHRPMSVPTNEHPLHKLSHRLAVWIMVLVLVCSFGSTMWLNREARQALIGTHQSSVESLVQTVATSLAHELDDGWTLSAHQMLDAVQRDPRIAFIEIIDPQGKTIRRRLIKPVPWSAYHEHACECDLDERCEDPILLDDGSVVVAAMHPIKLSRPHNATSRSQRSKVIPTHFGDLIIGFHETQVPVTLAKLRSSQVIASMVVCLLAMPLVFVFLKRWLSPLGALTRASRVLALGKKPPAIKTRGNDELGLLSRTFNTMVDRLFAAHQQLASANQSLESQVAHRTAELQSTNQRLEEEARDKDEFLRAVTHDLGAPLRNISGLASMLAMKYEKDLTNDAIRKLERINANAKHQTELIHDLLELSRLRNRSHRKQSADLSDILKALHDNFEYDLIEQRIELQIPDELPTIYVDTNRIRQVFQNLLDNAIKYMLDAEQRLITVTHSADEHRYYFSVSDTGQGISEKDLPNVFQVFRRATYSGTHQVPGKGIGLAWVKSIIESYGGTIHVSSELGKGTTFTFTLDRAIVGVPPEPPGISMQSARQAQA